MSSEPTDRFVITKSVCEDVNIAMRFRDTRIWNADDGYAIPLNG